jgi:hypothetical protein
VCGRHTLADAARYVIFFLLVVLATELVLIVIARIRYGSSHQRYTMWDVALFALPTFIFLFTEIGRLNHPATWRIYVTFVWVVLAVFNMTRHLRGDFLPESGEENTPETQHRTPQMRVTRSPTGSYQGPVRRRRGRR